MRAGGGDHPPTQSERAADGWARGPLSPTRRGRSCPRPPGRWRPDTWLLAHHLLEAAEEHPLGVERHLHVHGLGVRTHLLVCGVAGSLVGVLDPAEDHRLAVL